MSRASFMGVDIPLDNFEKIDLIKELEKSRNNLASKNESHADDLFVVHHDNGRKTHLALTWFENDEIDDSFSVVRLRKSKKGGAKKSVNVDISRPVTRSQRLKDMSVVPPSRSVRQKKDPLEI
jgi:hypothetical protein